jgi:hypothetical protein
VFLSSSIDKFLKCDSQYDANGNYIVDPNTNFVDILGIGNEFDFSSEVASPKAELVSAAEKLDYNRNITELQEATVLSKNNMWNIVYGIGYDFAADQALYYSTLSTLRSGNTVAINALYDTGTNKHTLQKNPNSAQVTLTHTCGW